MCICVGVFVRVCICVGVGVCRYYCVTFYSLPFVTFSWLILPNLTLMLYITASQAI